MASIYIPVCLFKVALPILLTVCSVFRPCLLSGLYLLLYFILPMIPVPTNNSTSRCAGIYLKIIIALSSINLAGHIIFQMLLAFTDPPYSEKLVGCSTLEKILRHVGFVRLDHINPVSAITWLSPEIIMFVSSIVIFIVYKKLTSDEDTVETGAGGSSTSLVRPKRRLIGILVSIGKYMVLTSLCVAGVIRPSIPGGIYFLVFLSATTWWACGGTLGKKFAGVMIFVTCVVFLHISAIFIYQMQWPQLLVPKDYPLLRYFGISPLMTVKCKDPRNILWSPDLQWDSFLNPLVLMWLYFLTVSEVRLLLMPKAQKKQGTFSRLEANVNGRLSRQIPQRLSNKGLVRSRTMRQKWQTATRKVRLINSTSPKRRYTFTGKRAATILQNSRSGSVVVTQDSPNDIPMEQLGKADENEEEQITVFDKFVVWVDSLIELAIRSSYIFTNVIMMAWSISFPSWLGFVLLLTANILWMVPNQRRAMLRFSPFLIFYAWLLLISGYIFSMDLTDEELPQVANGVDLGIIGFEKVSYVPCRFLLLKCLYTAMFWITLKQYSTEKAEERQVSALVDMAAPLHVSVGAAAGVSQEDSKANLPLKVFGVHAKKFLTKFWIWIVAITLFGVAITGQRMTLFRIVYMALLLLFLTTFQFSFRLWRKLMFSFLVIVILFSMVMLVLVYTYQFKNIREYWLTYLHITKEQQLDIGLEYYAPKQLFIRLATPTFFVIIVAIQIHYFHKNFITLTEPVVLSADTTVESTTIQSPATAEPVSEKTDLDTSTKFDITELGNMSGAEVTEKFKSRFKLFLNQLGDLVELILMFLNMHSPTIVLFVAFLMFTYDKCALYLPFVIFVMVAVLLGHRVRTLALYITSAFSCVVVVGRMLYQIENIDHGLWNSTCERMNSTLNNAEWLGFKKLTSETTLYNIVFWNILYIFATTFKCVIYLRQHNVILPDGKRPKRATLMFPNIKRSDADKNVLNCVKYLFNYGFYKFGFEMCAIMTVIVIGVRLDFYSLLYCCWLIEIMIVKRPTLRKMWRWFFIAVTVVVPFQYFNLVGLPPTLCSEISWASTEVLERLQSWLFLLNFKYDLMSNKLLTDMCLFIFVSRQALVFDVELKYENSENNTYPGGSNDSIIHHADDPTFINPCPDFITYCRTYLDVCKRAAFLSWMWISLAIMFLAATNLVSIFSVGYLIGSFLFLWHGSDLYLRPLPKILKAWNVLIGYNVFVIFVKAFFQIPGCIYHEELDKYACWVVQLFAVGCSNESVKLGTTVGEDSCAVSEKYVGVVWDGVLFAFLIIQRRIFHSYNFFHIINETKATTILASRGAELIEELRYKRLLDQQEGEKQVLEKIKEKMERIKANQQKLVGAHYKDTTNHHKDTIFPDSRPRCKIREPNSHAKAIRSGDYYMFDEVKDEELEIIEQPRVPSIDDDDEAQSLGKGVPLMEVEIHQVAFVEPKGTKEPQPGTSKDDDEDISELTEPKEFTTCQKILNWLAFAGLFLESCCLTLTIFLNKYSKDYRYILRVLNKEKKILKERTEYYIGLRLGSGQTWRPAGSYHTLVKESLNPRSKDTSDESPNIKGEESDQATSTLSQSPKFTSREGSPTNLMDDEETAEMSSKEQPVFIRLLLALWHILLSHSDIVCYFMIFLNQIKSATFLSLPLPFLVLCWGTLTIPRSSKTFWVTVIAYTEAIVLVKCIFQFEIIPWNRSQNISPLFPPRIIGIEKKDNYALWDLLLLLVIFFHRFLLKCLGLWKAVYVPAVVLTDGDYQITKDELKAIEDEGKLPSTVAPSSESSADVLHPKPLHLRKGSDLEKLVEEPDEGNDDEVEETNKEMVSIVTKKVAPAAHLSTAVRLGISRYQGALTSFFRRLFDPSYRIATDIYSYMFLCDFFNFFVILLGYSSFGPHTGDENVSDYLTENRIPVLFLVMLILQFLVIIVDRAIFLRKHLLAKVAFQFLQIVFLHIWLFILYPLITDRVFNSVLAPQIYYMVKCFYLLLSAYQIRSGYPTRVLGNFICRGYNYFNLFMYKAFLAVPFLFELRMIMDWMWTDTSMTIFDWMKMEDIFSHIFQVKCNRYCEEQFPQPRGEKKPTIIKYLMGGGALLIIFVIIWFPLVFFALGDAVGSSNIPYSVTMELRIGPYEPIYRMTAQSNSITTFLENDYNRLLGVYEQNKSALTFISNYQPSDIAVIKFSKHSAATWAISPPDRKRMIAELNATYPIRMTLEYFVSHKSNTKEDSGNIREEVVSLLEDLDTHLELLDMLVSNELRSPVILKYMVPQFIKVTNKGTAAPVAQLMRVINDPKDSKFRDIEVQRRTGGKSQEWWRITEVANDTNFLKILQHIPYYSAGDVQIYSFNEKLFPQTLNFITAGGIIGVYTTIVLVLGRLLRTLFSGVCFKIMFEDLPNVDRVLQLCYDVYLVRETREFPLEEDLFAKLIFLFRSPETLIKWTRPKEEMDESDEDDDPTDK
ncbi:piezo-type mechanosensitive ion channel component isoform X3 [Photinus pyralis]|uniref:piezo-type mechanosensitive ion channel component isoform X3 n=1 Tax=Photinus pyralis TaxID=7054 RepID=UPI00126701ED|nr:piezo-type mechanosensitive ion channel component isoform X3 [Photinus pyralis]